ASCDPAESTVMDPLPWWKRAIDLTACVMMLPVLGVFTLAMTFLTRLLSPGPVLFVQERVGYRGRRFMLYKFRTMRVGADRTAHENYCRDLMNSNAPMTKLDARGDARLIPGAWLLRASGLDELPQIINVLRGEMSLVGPRPCLPAEFEVYQPAQRRRCDTLPGLTGLWQVSGKNRTTFDEMIALDIRYGRELSFWNEIAIIFLTVPSLVRQVSDTSHARKSPEILAVPPGVVVPPSALAETPTQ
ncbi:MAG TPA: sugar transferase, partial [Candidatus Didemnitutus sp.]|nr:sugar transferase [Candidatus Didemnitutus sp.]